MDGQRFDTWTKGTFGSSRRGLLKGLAGGALAVPLAAFGLGGAAAQDEAAKRCKDKGERCDRDADCCNKLACKNRECKRDRDNGGGNGNCNDRGERCDRDADCCGNLECKNRECKRNRNNDNGNDNCKERGERCDRDGDCCGNLECRNDECKRR